jgi:hypothetical protein
MATGEANDEFGLTKYLCSKFGGILTCRKVLHVADSFTSVLKGGVLLILSYLKSIALGRV